MVLTSARMILAVLDPQPGDSPLPFQANAPVNPVSLVFVVHVPVLFLRFLYQSFVLRPLLHREVGGDANLEEIPSFTEVLGLFKDLVPSLRRDEPNAQRPWVIVHSIRELTQPVGELDVSGGVNLGIHSLEEVSNYLEVLVLSVSPLDRVLGFTQAIEDKIVLPVLSLPQLGTHSLGGLRDEVKVVLLPFLLVFVEGLGDLVDLLIDILDILGVLVDGELHLGHLLLEHQHPLAHVGEGRRTSLTCPEVAAGGIIDGAELLDELGGEGGAARVAPAVTL